MIKLYCNNRTDILEKCGKHYNVETKLIKELFLRQCFLGTFDGWCKDNKLINIQPNEFINKFQKELTCIANQLKDSNNELFELAKKSKEAKNEKNIVGSFFAKYLQEYEFRIVQSVIQELMENTNLMNHPLVPDYNKVGIYEYDGIKLLLENVDKFKGGKTPSVPYSIE